MAAFLPLPLLTNSSEDKYLLSHYIFSDKTLENVGKDIVLFSALFEDDKLNLLQSLVMLGVHILF